MKTAIAFTSFLFLAACGSDDDQTKAIEQPRSVVAYADIQEGGSADLNPSNECSWNVSSLTVTSEFVSDGQGNQLSFEYETVDGAFYKATEGGVTRWLQVYEKQGFYRVGVSCAVD